jgi:hypothetical protein
MAIANPKMATMKSATKKRAAQGRLPYAAAIVRARLHYVPCCDLVALDPV